LFRVSDFVLRVSRFMVPLLLLVWPCLAGGLVTDEELAIRRDWVGARFEGRPPAPPTDPALVVLANHGPVLKNARAGKPLRIAGQDFKRGLLAHAPSQIVVRLPAPGDTFTAVVGIDSNEQTSGGHGSVDFLVQIGGVDKFRSGVLREGMAGKSVKVGLGGVTELVIRGDETPDGNGWDHADWAEAKVLLKDGREVWLDDLPARDGESERFATEPPFSFVYGGRPSTALLGGWKLERRARVLAAGERQPPDGLVRRPAETNRASAGKDERGASGGPPDAARGPRALPTDTETEHTLRWTDPATGLQVRCVAIEYADFPTVEWTLYFRNTGTNDTPILSDIQALDLSLKRPADGEFILHHHTADNCTADSYEPHALSLAPNAEHRFASAGGRPTTGGFPYFNLEQPGGGLIAVVGWPGQWAAQFTRDADRGLRLRAGQELTRLKLHPGEEVRSPLVVLQFWKGGDWLRAQNLWRRWMVAHNLPRPGGRLVPTHYGGCFGNLRPLAGEEIEQFDGWGREGIRLDYWFIDAGWYTHPDGWWNVGTWEIDRERFPRGLREVADHVHQKDARFVVWFEPERVVDGSWLEKNHPEWILRSGGARLLNLGHTNAWQWVLDRINGLLTSDAIDVYRQDFNMDPLGCWRAADAPDRQGLTEIRHVEGYLAFWDELLRRHPGLLIDTCASGGRRNDLETLRRAVPLLRSDYPLTGFNATCSEGQQCHTLGISLWMPFHGTGMPLSDAYSMRSGFVPAYRLGWDVRDRKVDLPLLHRTVAEFRQAEKFFLGDFYPLARWSLAKDVWVAWQYDRPDQGEGLVQAFRREDSPYEMARFKLRGLDSTARYLVTDLDHLDRPARFTGRELLESGLPLTLPAPRSSGILIYRRLN
jgi:alpha-galactosidase